MKSMATDLATQRYTMTPAFKMTLIWIAGCLLAFVTAMNMLPASLVDGHYIPVSNDSFYHARRILDTVANPSGFYEFDPHIHYPEGSWITWPWGYDYGMAQIVRASLALFGPRDPMAVLAYIPVFAITITMALVLAIATAVGLPMTMRALVVMTFGISPLTQSLHGVGIVDHHFAEHICILASLLLGMLWWRTPESRLRATGLGVVLGASVCIHNGLFILQLPVLAAALYGWLRRESLDRRATIWFAASLVLSTVLVALPADAFQQGAFKFWYLSWFHVYVAVCTAIFMVLLAYTSFTLRWLITLAAIAAALCVPLATQLIAGGEFISGRWAMLKAVDEVQSPVVLAFDSEGAERISALYGLGIWLSPIWLGVIGFQIFREQRPALRFFWLVSFGAMVLLLFQLRFFYYGSIALYIVPFWCFERLRESFPRYSKPLLAACCVFAFVALIPSFKAILYDRPPPGLDTGYANARKIFPVLADACRKSPGLALGDANQGHYIRYFTDCSVLANNFRMTPQDAAKIELLTRLYQLSPEEFLKRAPGVRYLIVMLKGQFSMYADGTKKPSTEKVLREVNGRLNVDMLLTPADRLPPQFHKLYEVTPRDLPFPLAALFEIRRGEQDASPAHPASQSGPEAAGEAYNPRSSHATAKTVAAATTGARSTKPPATP